MAIFDIKLPASIARALNLPVSDARRQQIKVLKKLLRKARFTEFGQRYRFDEILQANRAEIDGLIQAGDAILTSRFLRRTLLGA